MTESMFQKPEVRLIGYTKGYGKYSNLSPDEIAAYAAGADFVSESLTELYENDMKLIKHGELTEEKRQKKIDRILNESYGRGHGSVGDQIHFNIEIKNCTRSFTLFDTSSEFAEHEQQSFRRTDSSKGVFASEAVRDSSHFKDFKETNYDAYSLYEEMLKDKGIPKEDARFHLPLAAKTNITTCINVRETHHLHAMLDQGEVPSDVKYTVNRMVNVSKKVAPKIMKKRESNYKMLAWRPATQIFASTNKTLNDIIEKSDTSKDVIPISSGGIDITEYGLNRIIKYNDEAEYANLKHYHSTFLVKNSIVMNHQLRRQRTMHLSDESFYDAVKRKNIIIPPKIKDSKYYDRVHDQNYRMLDLYEDMKKDIPRAEAIGTIPHSLQIYTLIHVDGFNSIHFIGKRTCTEAQWEIRDIAKGIANYIKDVNPELGKYTVPQGKIYGKCPERNPCGLCD